MKSFLKILCWIAIVPALIINLILVFYAEEDWRGARDWAACQRDLAAKGEILDLHQLAPPGKPEDDLSKNPIFAPLYAKDDGSDAPIKKLDVSSGEKNNTLPKLGSYQANRPIDLEAWQKFYRSLPQTGRSSSSQTPAQDVLQALSAFSPQMDQIDAAVSNPSAYWPTDYHPPFLTRFSAVTGMLRIARILHLRAIARLENNETDLAEKDYLFSFRLYQSLPKSCFVINYLVAIGIRAIDDSILWEGLRRHAWSDAQLREMESALAVDDMLVFARQAIRTDRAECLDAMEYVQNGHYDQLVDIGTNEDAKSVLGSSEMLMFLRGRPSGWGKQELVYLSNDMQKKIDAIDPLKGTLDSSRDWNQLNFKTWSIWKRANYFMPAIMLGPIDQLGVNTARSETNRRLARLACRLEEYRIAHNAYPDKLDDLPDLPEHLNQEVLSEQPLQYHRQGDSYQLYSLGWDQKDNGGQPDPHNDKTKGDWPWPSP